MHQKQKYCNIK